MMNSSDSLLYNLSYLSSVIHPVIILRLLEHRLFTPLFKKKAVTSNPPILVNPLPPMEHKNVPPPITPSIGMSALASIPTLPRPDPFKRQRSSLSKDSFSSTTNNDRSSLLTKFAHSTYDKHRKQSKNATPSTSISGITSALSQISTGNNLSTASTSGANGSDLSALLTGVGSPGAGPASSSNQSTSSSRKWFWRSSEKSAQSNIPNDRNPLLQAIVETDAAVSANHGQSTSNAPAGGAGVGEIKLLEKELLNLPTFQLSDSQNPLLPSPTSLSYDFAAPFDQTNLSIKETNSPNSVFKPRAIDDDCEYHVCVSLSLRAESIRTFPASIRACLSNISLHSSRIDGFEMSRS